MNPYRIGVSRMGAACMTADIATETVTEAILPRALPVISHLIETIAHHTHL